MASYDAQINLLVAGQRELTRLADRLRAIERQIVDINSIAIKPQPRDPATGRFTRDPDREVRLRAARLRRIGQEEERNARLVRSRLVGQNAELERSILYQSRLNSAVELYQRRLEEFARGGSGQRLTQELQDQVGQIQSAYEAATAGGTRNLSLVRSLATELGRVVERQNEANRASRLQSKGFFDSQAFERRIAGLREAGLPVSAFSTVGRQMASYRSAVSRGNQPEAQDFARRIKENLDRLARELDQAFAEFRRGQSVQKAARSWEKFFEDASAEALRIRQNSAETRQSWQTFFEDAAGQALLIKQNTKDAKDSWKGFFDDAASQALRVKQNAKDTSDSWRIFFEDAGAEALKIKQDASRTSESWKGFFENAAYQALQIKQNARETSDSWRVFFSDAAEQALLIKQNAKETRSSWQAFFEDAANQAFLISQNSKETRSSWQAFFEEASAETLFIKQSAKNTASSWKEFFNEASQQALAIRQNTKNTAQSWRDFFDDASGEALRISQDARDTAKRWKEFFDNASSEALQIRQNAKETRASWQQFFEDAAAEAFAIAQSTKKARASWQAFFEDAASQALQIKQNSKETRLSWENFFDDAAYQAFAIKEAAKATRASWEKFFQDAEEQAGLLRRRPISAMSAEERVSSGVIDFPSLRASRRQRVASGRARQEAIRRAASEGLIGGAFPLLFGQGVGATLGGGLGGAFGGFAGGGLGFGLSLAGTALGTAFDTATQSARDFNAALEETGDATDVLQAALGRVDKETKTLIKNLAESGQQAAAAEASFEALAQQIGVEQAEAFQRSGKTAADWGATIQTQLTRLYANAILLAEAIAGIFPQRQTSVFDIVEAQPEQPLSQSARDRIEDLAGQNNLLQRQVDLVRLTTDASIEQRLQLERQIALQEYVNDAVDLERQLKQNLLSTQEYNLKLKAAELNLTKELYSLENAAADERQRRAREAEQEAKSVAKEQERLVQNILGLQAELLQAGLAGADIDVEGTRVREGQAAALQLELDQLQQKLEYEARVIDLQLQQKLASSEISVQERTLLESIYREQIKNLEAQYQVRKLTLQQAQAQLALEKFISAEQSKAQAAAPFEQFRRDQELDAQYAKTYYRLLVEGIKPAEAERFANFERLVAEQLILLDQQIALTSAAVAQAEAYGASADEIIRLRTELENLNKARGAVTEQAALGPGPAVEEIPGAKIQEFISTAGQELKDLESVAIRVSQGIGDAVGNSLTNGINGLIEGTATAKEVFANFLNDVAGILMQESAKMIATYIAIGIARQFAGFFGGGSNADPLKGVGGADWMKYTTPNANGNMYTSNGIVPFANGGMFTNSIVSSPTLFKFADGGVSQMGLMGEAGPEAIMPLKRGPGGRLGVDASGSGGDNIAVTVNVDAKGSSVQGDDQRGNQLGRAISAAVQQELIKQKRPGGLLS